jgi:hypothetical protein
VAVHLDPAREASLPLQHRYRGSCDEFEQRRICRNDKRADESFAMALFGALGPVRVRLTPEDVAAVWAKRLAAKGWRCSPAAEARDE